MNAKILVIDDNEDILFMLKAMLQLKEYDVYTRETAENIEYYIEQINPDVILMDMLLSGADGREVCRKFKADAQIQGIPIVMISAMPNAKRTCLDAGADFFVGKPFEMVDMFNAIYAAVEKNEMNAV